MVKVCLILFISATLRSGGFVLRRSGDAVSVQFVVSFPLAIISEKQNYTRFQVEAQG
ncbi:hypothetical protein QUA23_23995 [Microcoleus sp. Pol1C5]|uniref:hypothetical protein n=1 Tax=Microcoleus sp. POL1_C1 TaxID=2818870 RepID=UPI002FD2FB15